MDQEYRVEKVTYAKLKDFMQDDRLRRALIETEVLVQEGIIEFVIFNNRLWAKFEACIPMDLYDCPEFQKTISMLLNAVGEARKIVTMAMDFEDQMK